MITPVFLSPLRVEQVTEDTWRLLVEFRYDSAAFGGRLIVPEGYVTDFASVPRVPIAYLVAGGEAHKPALLHDFLYGTHLCSRATADAVFLEAMALQEDVAWRRRLMWAAVRLGGRRAWESGPERFGRLGNKA